MKFETIKNEEQLDLYIIFINALIDEDCKRGLSEFEQIVLDRLGDMVFEYQELECEKYLS